MIALARLFAAVGLLSALLMSFAIILGLLLFVALQHLPLVLGVLAGWLIVTVIVTGAVYTSERPARVERG